MSSYIKIALVIITIFIVLVSFVLNIILAPPPIPKLENTWWGPGGGDANEDTSIKPFKIQIPKKDLKDLQYRLANHRPFTPPLDGTQQQYGFNTKLLEDVVQFWKTKYYWKEREQFLNKFPQFLTKIQGLDIHFIHVKPTGTRNVKVLPLLLLHGWPGSVREFYEIIPLLTTPQKGRNFVFEVIAPSLPGYAFSQAAVRPGLGSAQMAVVFKNFMNRLGFHKYYVQGGDFGSHILRHMAILFPDSVLGLHSNMCTVYTPTAYLKTLLGLLLPSYVVKPEHHDRVYPLGKHFEWRLLETGYFHLQATKPDTLGVGLTDSPVGLAAYILEKFTTGTNHTWQQREDGGLTLQYSYTDLLDNIMIYWLSGSITTTLRLYAESFNKAQNSLGIMKHPVRVPSACARFSHDFFYTPDGLLGEIFPNLMQLSDYEGGHFAAFQLPNVLAEDVYRAIEKFEKFNNAK